MLSFNASLIFSGAIPSITKLTTLFSHSIFIARDSPTILAIFLPHFYKWNYNFLKWYKWDVREDGTFTTTYNASWTTKYKYIDDDTLETSYPAGTKFIWTRLSNDVSTAPTTPDDYVKPSAFGESDSNEPTTVEIGLSKDQVIELWGYPTRKNITETKYGKHEQWVYEKFSKTRYVYFDNDVVTAIQY